MTHSDGNRTRICRNCEKKETVKVGDINGDGVIDTLDLMTLRAYLAGKIETISSAADINGDGTVDALDLAILRKMLVDAE